MTENVEYRTINGKYRIVWEQAASTKGVLGFKVEANGDTLDLVKIDADNLLEYAKTRAPMQGIEIK